MPNAVLTYGAKGRYIVLERMRFRPGRGFYGRETERLLKQPRSSSPPDMRVIRRCSLPTH